MKTPQEIYDYESKRIDRYTEEFETVLNNIDTHEDVKENLRKLFVWNGHARAIKSKAYQDLKKNERDVD